MKMLPLGLMPFFQLNCKPRMCLFSSGCSDRAGDKKNKRDKRWEICVNIWKNINHLLDMKATERERERDSLEESLQWHCNPYSQCAPAFPVNTAGSSCEIQSLCVLHESLQQTHAQILRSLACGNMGRIPWHFQSGVNSYLVVQLNSKMF